MIRGIVQWPDPILSRVCAPIGQPDDDVRALARDMLDTMYDAPGRGLAAPQVGVGIRLFVMDAGWKAGAPTPLVFIDPKIEWASAVCVTGPEACLSIPGVTAEVERATEIRIRWTDPDGEGRTETLGGFEAVCVQHEIDHLNGLVIFDRVSGDARERLLANYAG